jgi:hypothetical protein
VPIAEASLFSAAEWRGRLRRSEHELAIVFVELLARAEMHRP